MLVSVLAAALVSGSPAASDDLLGTWKAMPTPGIATIDQLTFTSDGRVLGGEDSFIGNYTVSGPRVTVPSRMGTLIYMRTSEGRLCAPAGRGVEPLAGSLPKGHGYIVCYHRLKQPS